MNSCTIKKEFKMFSNQSSNGIERDGGKDQWIKGQWVCLIQE